jgi:hypothetical protein
MIPSSKLIAVPIDIDESAWLLDIFTPRVEIYFDSQLVFYCKLSSEIPFLSIKIIDETIAWPVTTNFRLISNNILFPRSSTFYCIFGAWQLLIQSFTDILSDISIYILPKFYFRTSAAFNNRDKLYFTFAYPIIS